MIAEKRANGARSGIGWRRNGLPWALGAVGGPIARAEAHAAGDVAEADGAGRFACIGIIADAELG
jgi:hypothetical protein